jgi:hypothetical protein
MSGTLSIANGVSMPLWFADILDPAVDLSGTWAIATEDIDPITSSSFTASEKDLLISNGFAVCNVADAAGIVYAVTYFQYMKNKYSLTGLIPRKIALAAGDWCLTPVVKIFAGNHASYATTVTALNIGVIK